MAVTPLDGLRLLHAADLHVGLDQPAPGGAHHEECVCGVDLLADAVAAEGPDVVLIAGDLFDHGRIDPETFEWVWTRLGDLGIPVVVLPGNHDPHDATSLYRRNDVSSGTGVVLLDDADGAIVRLCDDALAIWGRATTLHAPSSRPLADAPSRADLAASPRAPRWYVVAAHGHHRGEELPSRHWSSTLTVAEVEATGADYVALGHWHTTTDVTAGAVPAWYPGAPAGAFASGAFLRVDLRTGRPALVTLVRPVPRGVGCAA